MDARAILFTGVGTVSVDTIALPDPEPSEGVSTTLVSAVSPGTELRTLAGKQAAMARWPLVPGYASVGLFEGKRYLTGGSTRVGVGKTWAAHMSHMLVPARGLIEVPENVDTVDASLSKMAAIAYRGVRISTPRPHEQVLIVGLGLIGQLSARLFNLTGARVIAFDLSPFRVEKAREAGVDAHVPVGPIGDAIREFYPKGADIVVDSTGAQAVLDQSISAARIPAWGDTDEAGSRVVVQGSYADDAKFDYDRAFKSELTVHFPRDCRPADYRVVLDLLARKKLSVSNLVERHDPSDAPEVYRRLQQATDIITAAFEWSK